MSHQAISNILLTLIVILTISFVALFFIDLPEQQKEPAPTSPSSSDSSGSTAPSSPTTTPDPTANWQIYRNEEFGFEFKYPKNWNQKNSQYIVVVFDNLPGIGKFFIWTEENPQRLPLPDFYNILRIQNDNEATLRKNFPFSDIEPLETFEINGIEAFQYITGNVIAIRETILPYDGIIYHLNMEDPLSDGSLNGFYRGTEEEKQKWIEARLIYNQILSTFKFIR